MELLDPRNTKSIFVPFEFMIRLSTQCD